MCPYHNITITSCDTVCNLNHRFVYKEIPGNDEGERKKKNKSGDGKRVGDEDIVTEAFESGCFE